MGYIVVLGSKEWVGGTKVLELGRVEGMVDFSESRISYRKELFISVIYGFLSLYCLLIYLGF